MTSLITVIYGNERANTITITVDLSFGDSTFRNTVYSCLVSILSECASFLANYAKFCLWIWNSQGCLSLLDEWILLAFYQLGDMGTLWYRGFFTQGGWLCWILTWEDLVGLILTSHLVEGPLHISAGISGQIPVLQDLLAEASGLDAYKASQLLHFPNTMQFRYQPGHRSVVGSEPAKQRIQKLACVYM